MFQPTLEGYVNLFTTRTRAVAGESGSAAAAGDLV